MAGRITRVVIENFRSIKYCDVSLGDLTFLVGRNGAGKSNFLHALTYLSSLLHRSELQSVDSVLHWDHPAEPLSIEVEFTDFEGHKGSYRTKIAAGATAAVEEEDFDLATAAKRYHFTRRGGTFRCSLSVLEPPLPKRLALSSLASFEGFDTGYRLLSRIESCSPVPRSPAVFKLDVPTNWDAYGMDTPSVLAEMEIQDPEMVARIVEYLQAIVPEVEGVGTDLNNVDLRYIYFVLRGRRTPALQVSDGTLRALAILVALFRPDRPSVIGVEEPENHVHPGAAAVLLDALREASESKQVLVTTHSGDLLDAKDIDPDSILAVTMEDGATLIGPLDEAGKEALHRNLYTAGELLRMNQLSPESASKLV